jgi:PAS domain S-box-containing protein
MLGYNPGELYVTLELVISWLHPDDKEKALSSFNACLEGKSSVLRTEFRMRTRSENWKWILSSGKVIQFNKDGTPMRMIGTHTDITELKNYQQKIENYANDILKINEELKNANRELEEANNQLKMLNEQKNEFVSLASHELRTPLISIIGFTQTLLSKDIQLDCGEREHYLHIIESEGVRLSKLVTNLLDIARIEKKSTELNIEEFDIIEFTKETINAMRIPPAISVSYQVKCSSLPKIHGDKEKLKQVYLNLLYNAIHHTGAGGEIIVCIDIKDSEFFIAVQDTGSGITEEDLPKIFDRFYRGKDNRSRKTQGSGLGLSISKEIIQAHGGTIWAKSKLGEGSTFFFTIPVNDKIKKN